VLWQTRRNPVAVRWNVTDVTRERLRGVRRRAVVRFAAMDFLILGPLEVSDDGRKLALGGPKQRAVLAHLILRANRVVQADLLIDGLWGDEPPESARNTLQTYVYRLRKLLGESRIEGRDGGYVLIATPDEIDGMRFESLVKEGKASIASDPAAAAAILADALSLWRADALADVTEEPSLRGEAARLEELRLAATEHWIAAEIAMGGHSMVVSELESLTARYPLRERMWAHLMLALYRSGRQAEALSTYERARQVLGEELGADPSPELQRLHEQILTRAPDLAAPKPERARPPSVRSSRVDLQPGTEVAGYRIVGTLGRGGMSVVYLAEHDWLQRKVALKVLAPQLAEDERFRERFVRESRLAASLDHPNVIPIYEAGASGGDLFIAMRYVEGTDLRTLLHEGGALEPGRAVAIVRQVAAALDAAHEQGLVHRDVKPGNVLLARQRGSEAREHVYLSDFGLTKRSASDSGITGTGQFVGTLEYAAPEQFKGDAADARTDVYSLGCVLFECLTGSPPFTSENDAGLMYAHLQEEPPAATAARSELAPAIDGVVAKAMAKAPADRYPAAGALADEASRALGHGVDGARGVESPLRRTRLRQLVPAIAVALALAAGIILSSVLRGDTPRAGGADPQASASIPSPTPPPTFRTVERALSPDEERLLDYLPADVGSDCLPLGRDEPIQGELAALVCRTEDVEVLYELFPTRDEMDAAFQGQANGTTAPTGECATDRVAVTPYSVGGEPAGRVLCYTLERGAFSRDLPDQSHIAWTDENGLIYAHAVRNDLSDLTLYEWWLSSSGPVLSPGDEAAAPLKDPPVAVGPRLRDGSYLLSVSKAEAHRAGDAALEGTYGVHIDGNAYAFAIDGAVYESGEIQLQKPNTVVFDPDLGACNSGTAGEGDAPAQPALYEWSASGDSLRWELKGGGTCAGPQGGVEGLPWTRAPSGLIALERDGEITLMDPGGFGVEQLAVDTETRRKDPEWSPDGSKIAYAQVRAQEDDDLYVMNADGTGLTRLTEGGGDDYDPVWSPDGRLIAFAFDDLGFDEYSTSIHTVDPGSGEVTELVTRPNERVGWPSWSPDGNRIAFSTSSGDGSVLFVMDADGSNVTKVREEPTGLFGMPVAWSPDGLRIVFWGHTRGGDETLLSIRPDGTGLREFVADLPPEASTLTVDWSPNGRWVVAGGVHDLAAVELSEVRVFLIRADGSELFEIGVGGSEPAWRPNER
jgi:serine/threonine protein kinase/DNA-binding SARP family transcriptional activator